jgi:N-acetylmuramoyl-L-alanine amidase
MNTLILFVLKSILVSGLLYTWYIIALRNKRHHTYNRFFLLFILYASIQIPLLHFTWSPASGNTPLLFSSAKMLVHTFTGAGEAQPAKQLPPAEGIDWLIIIIGISAMVSLVMLIQMIIRILWIVRMSKQYPCTVTGGITLLQTDLPKAPFSFMNKIFWSNSISPETESGRMILRHELAHIKQKHTYDKLASQLLTCIFWMNPFYWFVQKELCMVHEFIADEQAIITNNDNIQQSEYTEAFAKMLLQVHDRTDYLAPEHQFFSSPIKRRLTMLQNNKTVRASVLRRAVVVPLIAGSIFIFAFSPQTATKPAGVKTGKKIVLVIDAGHGGNDEGCRSGTLIEKNLTLKVAEHIKELAPGYNIEAHLTRNDDQHLTLEERVAFSNKLQPDAFISIHIDDQPQKATGKGTFDIAIYNKNEKADESKQLAYAIYKHTSRPEWEQKNAFSEKSIFVLYENTAAAALIEIGNIKNKEQMQHIEDDTKLNALCSQILEGVVEANKK